MSSSYKLTVVIRAVGAGLLALGSKAAALAKGTGGVSSIAKGFGGLALGGGAAAALVTQNEDGEQQGAAAATGPAPVYEAKLQKYK